MATTVVEVDDDRWDEFVGDPASGEPDPYGGRSYLAAVAAATGSRAIMVVVEGEGWSANYPLVLRPLRGGRWLARSPEYGGPWIRRGSGCPATPGGSDRAADATAATAVAVACRAAVDHALAGQGVISEVFLLSPWLPDRPAIAATWSAREGKPVCLVHGADQELRWGRLRKGRRSDINRARRDMDVAWGALDVDAAVRFAGHYQAAMEGFGAADRWRFDTSWFRTVVEQASGRLKAATVQGPGGGATALFLTGGANAAYFLASRWGVAPGAPSLALWIGIERLVQAGVAGVTLGGGAGDDDNDPVLAFKRSFADEEVPLLVGARVFDVEAHNEAVARGDARPLPDGAVPS